MSAGAFEIYKYESDTLDAIILIKLQPETMTGFTVGGDPQTVVTGATDLRLYAGVGLGKRQSGVRARRVSIEWTAAPPDGYKANQRLYIPVPSKIFFDSIEEDATCTYLGANAKVKTKVVETKIPGG